jgi:hypothetical protein
LSGALIRSSYAGSGESKRRTGEEAGIRVAARGTNRSNRRAGAPFSTRRTRGWREESRGWTMNRGGIRALLECVFLL